MDITTSMAASIAAFCNGAFDCHIESGLFLNNKWVAFHKKITRQITGRLAYSDFAPAKSTKKILL